LEINYGNYYNTHTRLQEMVMVEDEKKRRGRMGNVEEATMNLERNKDMAMKRIPKIDKFGRAYATGERDFRI
jgi:hypothetical protein